MTKWISTASAVVVAAALALLPALPAAASGGLEVSVNGGSYASSASGSVFSEVMVPGETQQGQFRIRNTSQLPGFVRIVMSNVSVSDPDLADVLTISAAAGGIQGIATPVTLAQPCWLLTEGQVVPPGGTLVVTTTAVLGQLDGTSGQGATAAIDFGVSLSDMTPGSLSPDNCGSIDIAVPALPTGGGGVIVVPGQPTGPNAGTVVPLPDTELPVLSPPGFIGIDPNTWHLFEEYWILVPIGSAVVGGIAWWMLWGRRREASDDQGIAA